MDPATTNRKNKTLENISIKLIDFQLKKLGIFSNEIDEIAEELIVYGEKLIPARNKRIAHFDKECHEKAIILGETTEAELNQFLINIQKYSDFVGCAIGVGPLDFSCSGCLGDVQDLLNFLSINNT